MRIIPLLLLFIVVLSTSFSRKNNVNSKVVVHFQKKSCRGKCPQYQLWIYSNRQMILEGQENFRYIGTYQLKLKKAEYIKLINLFLEKDFFSFEEFYHDKKTDLPATILSFTMDSTTKKIIIVSGAPTELVSIKNLLEDIAERKDWIESK